MLTRLMCLLTCCVYGLPWCCLQQPWVQDLIASHKDSKLVFSADGNSAEARQHLSTGLSQDHLVRWTAVSLHDKLGSTQQAHQVYCS